MALNEGLRVEEIASCLLCGKEGRPLYRGLRDRLFGALGDWDLSRCPGCGLVWLNPRPVVEEIAKLYPPIYSTPTIPSQSWLSSLKEKLKRAVLAAAFGYDFPLDGPHWRWIGRMASLVWPLREMVGMSIMYLSGAERGRLLEVGCGNGRLLALFRELGWDVLGVEPDAEAARVAREHYGVPVIVGTLEAASVPEGSVDVVTLHHVVEHVHDPISLFKECRRALREGGKIVVVTPNLESLGHIVFRESWRGLEPPRHLHLFTLRTLQACARQGGFDLGTVRTVAASGRRIWAASRLARCRRGSSNAEVTRFLRFQGWAFQVLEEAIRFLWREAGEELLLVATKPNDKGWTEG